VDDEPSHAKWEAVLSVEAMRSSMPPTGLRPSPRSSAFFDLILMDIRMQKTGGIEALKAIKEISPGIPIIMMTAYASVETAVAALKSGAYDS
jgi:two-component system response regulator HydG